MRTVSTLTHRAAPLDFHTILSIGEERGIWCMERQRDREREREKKMKLNQKSGGGEREEM